MRIAFIVCDNGMGHVRRAATVIASLRSVVPDAEISILADPLKCARFGLTVTHPFRTETTASSLVSGSAQSCRWDARLPDLSYFDRVVSDNLVEVLAVRPDAVLMGSFLWHQALPRSDAQFRDRADRLLERHRPLLLGTAPFVSKAAKSATRFQDVGFFVPPGISPAFDTPKAKGSLLIASGRGGGSEGEVSAMLEAISKGPRPSFDLVHVEPSCMPIGAPQWMKPADFSPEMYASVTAAVIRPGMGTVTDALAVGARLYCFAEEDNVEMSDNLDAIELLGVGACFRGKGGGIRALSAALSEYGDPDIALAHLAALRGLDFRGSVRSVPWILGAPA